MQKKTSYIQLISQQQSCRPQDIVCRCNRLCSRIRIWH